MLNLREILTSLADAYELEVAKHGGRSLARISTIVVNRGSFFSSLRSGKTCTLGSFEAIIEWFASADNWPAREIPASALKALNSLPINETSPAKAA